MDSRIPKIKIPGGRENKSVAFPECRLWVLFIQDAFTVGAGEGQ